MNIGLAGEYLTAGMISMEGIKKNEVWYASLTLKNYPGIDIFALRDAESLTEPQHVGIQVKSTYNQSSILIGITLSKESTQNDINMIIRCPFIFVVFNKDFKPSFYVLSREDMVKLVFESNNEYFSRAKEYVKKEQPIAINVKKLIPYKDNWDAIWK